MSAKTDVPLPHYMRGLPVNKAGYVVPWFVQWIDGEPDFRVMRNEALTEAIRFRKCWICGKNTGRHVAFVLGPMCAINRTSAEPPSHLSCAEYAAKVCPFLTRPDMTRRERNLDAKQAAGHMLTRNPGVALLWKPKGWHAYTTERRELANGLVANAGVLFDIGDPVGVSWWCEGRAATGAEVMASIESGLPALVEQAQAQPGGMAHLEEQKAKALALVPS